MMAKKVSIQDFTGNDYDRSAINKRMCEGSYDVQLALNQEKRLKNGKLWPFQDKSLFFGISINTLRKISVNCSSKIG